MTTDELLQRWSDGSITADELRELTAKLAKPEHQSALLDDWLLESSLPDRLPGAAVAGLQVSAMNRRIERSASVKERRWTGWLSWRPLAAAAAGIVLGMFCTSVVFAYVGPSLGKVITLLQDSFERGPAPLVTGVPIEAGRWSGDYSEVVGEQQGVKPQSGQKMLRFLRADYEGKPDPEHSGIADIYRLIDMRSYRQEFADGAAVVQFSAAFNAFAFPAGEDYEYKISLYAFDAETATNGSLRIGNTLNERNLAVASTGRIKLDRNPATWQHAAGDLRLPADTDFLLIHIAVRRPPHLPPKPTYAGHYLDDVRLTMRHSPLK